MKTEGSKEGRSVVRKNRVGWRKIKKARESALEREFVKKGRGREKERETEREKEAWKERVRERERERETHTQRQKEAFEVPTRVSVKISNL